MLSLFPQSVFSYICWVFFWSMLHSNLAAQTSRRMLKNLAIPGAKSRNSGADLLFCSSLVKQNVALSAVSGISRLVLSHLFWQIFLD